MREAPGLQRRAIRLRHYVRIVEQKIELGRKLVALRDTMPSNQKFGWAVRKQFGLDDPCTSQR